MRVSVDTRSTERVYIRKLSPLGTILVILITGLLSTAMLVLLLGAFRPRPIARGVSKSWIKVKNPKAPAATRAIDGTF
jgi:hypothetical protein